MNNKNNTSLAKILPILNILSAENGVFFISGDEWTTFIKNGNVIRYTVLS